jgi:branched-chain amino acid aminotransferase
MDIPFSLAEISQACKDIVTVHQYQQCFIRPLIWRGAGSLGLDGRANPIEAMVVGMQWDAYLCR